MKCNWENLVYVNYLVEPNCIEHLLPNDLELDLYYGKAVISFVCFQFTNARLYGIKIPFHQNFSEINIRTYVRSKKNPHVKGIYFISEMVPNFMTFFVGKFIYGEPFFRMPIKSNVSTDKINYEVENKECDIKIEISTDYENNSADKNKEQKFIIDRVYAFCGKKNHNSKIYRVEHREWNLLKTENSKISINRIKHINSELHNNIQKLTPSSIFITDGSSVDVIRNVIL